MRRTKPNLAIWFAVFASFATLWSEAVSAASDPVSYWNTVAIQAGATAGQGSIPGSRTLAIVQIAIHDALNAIDSRYERYALTGTAPNGASPDAAIAAAARDALVGAIALGPLPIPDFGTPATQAAAVAQVDAQYVPFLASIPSGLSKTDGIGIGQAAAAAIVGLRKTDHARLSFRRSAKRS